MSDNPYLRLLRPRPRALLWLLYGLFLVAGVAQASIVPLLPRLAGHYGLSATSTALLLALPGLAMLTVSVPTGLAADRFGARRVTVAAGVLLVISGLAQAAPSLAALLAGRVVFGVAFGVIWTAGMAWLSEIDGDGSRLGPSVTCSSVGIMVGPAVGGVLGQSLGLAVPFLAVAGVTLLVVAPLIPAAVAERGRPAAVPTGAGANGFSPRAIMSILRRPPVVAAAGALVVSGAVSGVSQLLISSDLHRTGMSTSRIGLAFSVAAVCYIAASAAAVRLGGRVRTLRVNAGATALLAAGLVPALGGAGAAGLVAALVLTAIPRALVSTIAYALAADPAAEERAAEGLVFGMLNGAWAAATVLMPLIAGALAQGGGASAGYLGVIVPGGAVAAWLLVQASGRRPARAVTAPRPMTLRSAHERLVHSGRRHGPLRRPLRRALRTPRTPRTPHVVGRPLGAHHRERQRAFAHSGIRQMT